jgi:hypothetical protein
MMMTSGQREQAIQRLRPAARDDGDGALRVQKAVVIAALASFVAFFGLAVASSPGDADGLGGAEQPHVRTRSS